MKNLAVLSRNQPLKLTEAEAEAKVLKVQISYDIAVPEAGKRTNQFPLTLPTEKVWVFYGKCAHLRVCILMSDPKLRKVTLQSRKVEAAKKPGK